MIDTVDRPLMSQFITEASCESLPPEVSQEADAILTTMPWDASGNRLDWSKIPGAVSIDWLNADERDIEEFINKTSIEKHEFVLVVYGARQKALACKLNLIKNRIDELSCCAAMPFYILGATIEEGLVKRIYSDIIEIDPVGKIWGAIKDERNNSVSTQKQPAHST